MSEPELSPADTGQGPTGAGATPSRDGQRAARILASTLRTAVLGAGAGLAIASLLTLLVLGLAAATGQEGELVPPAAPTARR